MGFMAFDTRVLIGLVERQQWIRTTAPTAPAARIAAGKTAAETRELVAADTVLASKMISTWSIGFMAFNA